MNIDERRDMHHRELRKLNDAKIALENKLGVVNGKIIYHLAAIQNLTRKKLRCKKEDM